MRQSTREGDQDQFPDKLDSNDNGAGPSSNTTKADPTSSSAWFKSKDPRIVRVSRAFGGKDRHSKVCTIRGLRDRRVRLSVPTAIQLYDLQDRLGLNQPSKVVDWLLNVAKDDIDELPPLQIPPGFNFIDQAHQAMISSSSSHAANQQEGTTSTLHNSDHQELGSKIMNVNWEEEDDNAPIDLQKSSFWTSSQPRFTKFKHAIGTKEIEMSHEKEMWNKGMNDDHQEDDHKLETLELGHGGGGGGMQLGSSSNFFPRSSNHSSLPNFLHNVPPYGSYYHLDYPSNFSLPSSSSQSEEHHHSHYNVVPSGPHVLVCPPAMSSQSYFPNSHNVATTAAAPMELDPRQFINHFQILNPTQQHQSSLHMSLDDVNKKR